ncbi:PilW family protein [Salinimonas sediminis]|uniref:Pilin n=1 Tax=Salinimonas sediminis TaxID=2303538 RepID=A0A346NNW6_9ALTE|nr:PilW family protein [Salinimonas sediminis]AXR07223.1 pilin [Salinimonas sediminis]
MKRAAGFSLVELMIALVLGLVITGGIIQIMVSSRVTNGLNQAIAQVQESGRFIITRLSRDLHETGRYDQIGARIDESVDTHVESAFIQNRPIGLVGDYPALPALGSIQAADGANDTLVVNLLAAADCSGATHDHLNNTEFHVVNVYQVNNNALTCTGYDGRILRGVAPGSVSAAAVTLMDNVESFQVQYGITAIRASSQGQAVRYVTASELPLARAGTQQVVALRIGVLLRSDAGQISGIAGSQVVVLNEPAITTPDNVYSQVFSQTLTLRNMKNFVRSAQ